MTRCLLILAVVSAAFLLGCAACRSQEPREAPANPAFQEWRRQEATGQGRPDNAEEKQELPSGYVPPPVSPPEPPS